MPANAAVNAARVAATGAKAGEAAPELDLASSRFNVQQYLAVQHAVRAHLP